MRIRTYAELIALETFEERFLYLKLGGSVGIATFGFDRYLNQMFYNSKEWRSARDYVIVRDFGCDLAIRGLDIFGGIRIHHMNPLATKDIVEATKFLLDPEYLICTSLDTHNAIHYGGDPRANQTPIVRTKNDTIPWK